MILILHEETLQTFSKSRGVHSSVTAVQIRQDLKSNGLPTSQSVSAAIVWRATATEKLQAVVLTSPTDFVHVLYVNKNGVLSLDGGGD